MIVHGFLYCVPRLAMLIKGAPGMWHMWDTYVVNAIAADDPATQSAS